MIPTITTVAWVPEFARGFVRDLRPRWAFEEEGMAYAVEALPHPEIKGDAYRRWQPFGQVPAYSDGAIRLFESGAIAIHIAEQGTVLMPADADARLRALQWVIAALNTVEPPIMQHAYVEIFEADKPWSAERRPAVRAAIESRLADLSAALADKTWLEGADFTVGDLMMISVLGGLRGTGYLDVFPNLANYVARGEARPAHVKAMDDQIALYAEADA